ncbi:hypothetical protein TSAR_002332 [Trichomalopsis sarcophagae]|uniref:CCHC-type domain-containing protein n=1 Tax=Trichomalopsis sarcophagae TaxID=543379 RepID=A0A232ESK0_9HYME|nr:hypothetical protein TSAR_002332 [Trichomalopsis sarcophagae]
MTRFARAKGSKSSNERLPDEPTPWHVMKQQLESNLEPAKEPQAKTKTARQLLNEKEDLYYAQSVGNVNTDWAEFDAPKKTNGIKSGKIEKKQKDQNENVKKAVDNVKLEEPKQVSAKAEKIVKENTSEDVGERGKNTKAKGKAENTFQTEEHPPTKTENANEDIQERRRNKKAKRKADSASQAKIVKTEKQENPPVKIENPSESKSENAETAGKLSKRQKRNQKKQNQKTDEKNDRAQTAPFNAEGNDWDNSVSFNKRRKFSDDQDGKPVGNGGQNNFRDRNSNSNFNEYKNFRRFGNNVPKKFQPKSAKPRDDKEHRRRKPDQPAMKVTINGMDLEIVKYDGFPVKKEDAERLTELRKEMVLKGIPKSEIDAAMKLERRKCEKALARVRRQVCFHCRKAGHNLSDCPELGKEEAGTGICFKCGSTEHTHFECKVNKSDDYRYAKCFICREQGHIAKQCPDNPKGLYPDGGSCKICGDVTHLKKDCPDLVKEKEETAITLDTIKDANLEVLDNETTKVKTEAKPTKKIVKF